MTNAQGVASRNGHCRVEIVSSTNQTTETFKVHLINIVSYEYFERLLFQIISWDVNSIEMIKS